MTSLNVATAATETLASTDTTSAYELVHGRSRGVHEFSKIIHAWKHTLSLEDLNSVAFKTGMLVSASLLSRTQALTYLEYHFKARRFDDTYRSLWRNSFENGAATPISATAFR